MEVIYSAQRNGFEAGKVYRNPRYFERADKRVTKVIVCGEWPEVVAAYRAIDVDVEVRPGPVKAGEVPPIPADLKSQVEGGGEGAGGEGEGEGGGGSAKSAEDIEAEEKSKARAEYVEVVGKQPGPKWDAETIRQKQAEFEAEKAKSKDAAAGGSGTAGEEEE